MEKHEQLPEPSISLDEPMYDEQDILQLFHISERTLASWRKNGLLPFLQIGGKIYYPKKLVEAQLEKYQDLKKDVDYLAELTNMHKTVDLAGRMVYNDKKQEDLKIG